jgi:hypothetical protein
VGLIDVPSRTPTSALILAASELRAARDAIAATVGRPHSRLVHHDNLMVLRCALAVYIAALEDDDLPVARKLRQELVLLSLVDDRAGR